jgi:prepilin-type processing-associated H-X9-DG protein
MDNRFKPDLPTRETFLDLPPLNRWLLGSGAALLALGVLLSAGPPVASGVASAVHPYTVQGKEEHCLANLRALGSALESYREQNKGRYPLLEQTAQGQNNASQNRMTWVSQLRPLIQKDELLCPSGTGDGETTSSYGFNAALSGAKQEDIPHPEQVVVLADRGEAHDLALLPPLEGWRAANAQASKAQGDAHSGADKSESSNVDFRHRDRVGVLYADGHAEMREDDARLDDLQSWGGALAIRQARAHLLQVHPLLQDIENAGKKSDEDALSLIRQKATAGKDLEKAMQAAYGLWTQNDGASFDAGTDRWGWQLAKWADKAGQPDFLQFFDKEQSRRSEAVLQDAKKDSGDKAWQKQESHGLTLLVPANWTRDEETEARYRRTFFRSASPHIGVQVERGERIKPGPESGIEWSGMEDEYRKTYGSRYKRVSMGETTLAGEAASLWEFEIDRKDAPTLHKLYVGRSHAWDSTIFTATAPAQDFASWKPLFVQMKDGLQRSVE